MPSQVTRLMLGSFLTRNLLFASAPYIYPATPQTTPSLPPGKACPERLTLLAVPIDYCWKRLHSGNR